MADGVLDTITRLIQSPPGQLAAGGALAAIVWKFFERVESVLKDDAKLEIAVWLLDRKRLALTLQTWPGTFIKMFDRVFGVKHLTWRCFWRSCLASCVALALTWMTAILLKRLDGIHAHDIPAVVVMSLLGNLVPDYLSLLESRYLLHLMAVSNKSTLLLLLADACATAIIASVPLALYTYFAGSAYGDLFGLVPPPPLTLSGYPKLVWHGMGMGFAWVWIYPAFFTSIWLWLYAGAGFLLKAARRYDLGFEWFNLKFDIDKKPLQSIGLVAGAMVAVLYWAAVIVTRVFT